MREARYVGVRVARAVGGLVALIAGLGARPIVGQRVPVADILFLGGRVLDGAGNPWVRGDIAVGYDRITFVGHAASAGIEARDTVDVHGLTVVPGFWDVHNHADFSTPHGRAGVPLLHQGITTVVQGVDGGGSNDLDRVFADYARHGVAVNVVRFVGHAAARRAVMGGDVARAARADELEKMKRYVARGMEQGAVGFSTMLAYGEGAFAPTAELVELNRVAGRYGGVYDTHDRDMGVSYRGIGYVASVREAITIAEEGGTSLVFSHFNALGIEAHRQMPEGIALIEAARSRGVNVMVGHHVYTASLGYLGEYALPPWVVAGGQDSLARRLADPGLRERIDAEMVDMLAPRGGPSKIVFAVSDSGLNGKSLTDVAAGRGVSVPELVRHITLERGVRVYVLNIDIYSMQGVRDVATREWAMTCLDGFIPASLTGISHPRSFGGMIRKLRLLVQDEQLITMPFAVRGMTSLPAQFYGIPDRGLIRPGFHADIAVLDEARLRDRATYENPFQLAEGVVHVVVNGRFALRDGLPTRDLPGRPLRRSGR